MLILLISIFSIVSIVMLRLDLKTGWNGESYISRNGIVFSGRNQDYGAYELRNNYNRRLTFIIGGVILFSFVVFGLKMFVDRPQEE